MYPVHTVATAQHPIVPNDINQSQLSAPYSSPLINRPSVFSSSHHQLQPFTTVVNPELPIQQPNVFQWSSMSPPSHPSMPPQRFSSLDIPENGVRWKCPEWMANQNIQPGSYMSFNGQQPSRLPFKRKATLDMETPVQSKLLITDEKMAAHLNGLHISSEFKAHNTNQLANASDTLDIDLDSSERIAPYPCSLQDIEEKLKRANKITVSDVVKSIQEEPMLPAAIFERFEKPSKALVIWQPPQRIVDLIVSKTTQEEKADDDEDLDNNNIELVDANNDSQMDLDS